MKRYSILNNLDYCIVCAKPAECIHEVYYGRNRQVSIKNGFCCGLCNYHHNMSNKGIHFDRELDLKTKQYYQKEYEKTHTREEFIKLIGKSYI